MSKNVLLCMDFQNDIVNPKGVLGRNGLAEMVASRGVPGVVERLRGAARKSTWTVAHVRVAYRSDYLETASVSKRVQGLKAGNALVEGTWGSRFDDRFIPLKDEMIFTKHAVNPFFQTGLLPWLASLRASHLFLCGVATNMVVESGARYADDVGFAVTVVEDGCASFSEEMHAFSAQKILPILGRVMPADEVIAEM